MLGLGRLIPRDEEFFTLFDVLTTHLATAAQLIKELFENPAQMQEKIREGIAVNPAESDTVRNREQK